MARIEIDPNYSAPTFSRATAGTDLFKKEDVQALAAAFSTHVHDAIGKGLTVQPPLNSLFGGAIADGTITSAKIADGAIGQNDIAAGAVTSVYSNSASSLESTTSATMVTMGAPIVPFTSSGGNYLIWFHGIFWSDAGPGGSQLDLSLQLDGGAFQTAGRMVNPLTSGRWQLAFVTDLGAIGAGAHTLRVGWSRTASTMNTDTLRTLVLLELKR